MSIVVLATGHHFRCILWEQGAIFDKEVDFLCSLNKIHSTEYILWRILTTMAVLCCKYEKKNNVKDVPMKNYELLNIQACPFFYVLEQGLLSISNHFVNFAMRCGTASKGASRRRAAPKRGSSLSGHWMGHLLSYSLSGGHDGAMLPINPRGLNGPLTSHFICSSHMYFSLNAPTHYWSSVPNK